MNTITIATAKTSARARVLNKIKQLLDACHMRYDIEQTDTGATLQIQNAYVGRCVKDEIRNAVKQFSTPILLTF